MRGVGQIAELVAIAEPDVGVIVNVGPVHLELLGTVERVAAAKAELIRDLRAGRGLRRARRRAAAATPHLRDDLDTWSRFGARAATCSSLSLRRRAAAEIEARGARGSSSSCAFAEPHNLLNTLAAVARARARSGCAVEGPRGRALLARCAARWSSSRAALSVVNDCYNANPMSMRAALDHLADDARRERARSRCSATMAELGAGVAALPPRDRRARRRARDRRAGRGRRARRSPTRDGFDGEAHAVADAEEAGALLEELARPGDRVLVKGSRSVGLERGARP